MRKLMLAALASSVALADSGIAQSVTYDYTGTVTEADGIYSSIAVGTKITGTYTFDLAAANASESVGPIGSGSRYWAAYNYAESTRNAPPVALVFSTTARVDGFSYATGTNLSGESSVVSGSPGGGPGGPLFVAEERNYGALPQFYASELSLQGSAQVPWSSAGLPLLKRANVEAFATFEEFIGSEQSVVGYDITSLEPAKTIAPEIDAGAAASALTLLLGGIAMLRSRGRV